VLGVIDGPALNQAIGNATFVLEAFERLIVDLPGDYREELQKVLGGNLAATGLLNVKPADVLRGYPGSAVAGQVQGWLKDPCKAHRVGLLVGALCHHLGKHPDVISLRKDRGAMAGLGAFLSQVGPHWSRPLDETLGKLNIQPTPPR
jgi:hypothetical protein